MRQPYGHIALSWMLEDRYKLDGEMMVSIAEEYMREMGIENTQYVIVQHNCTDNPHVHIAYSRVDYDGRLISISNDWKKNVRVCRELTRKYGFQIGRRRGKRECGKLHGMDERRQRMRAKVYGAYERSGSWADFADRLMDAGVRISFKMDEAMRKIAGVVFSDGELSCGGKALEGSLSFRSIDDMFGGELAEKELNANADMAYKDENDESTGIIPYGIAMEILLQPHVAVTQSGGGGGSNSQLTGWDGRTIGKKKDDECRARFRR